MKVMGRMLSLNGGENPSVPNPQLPKRAGMIAAQPLRAQPKPALNSIGLRQKVANRLDQFHWKIASVDTDPIRRIGFLFALAYLFTRFSFISEGVLQVTGITLYMNYWTAIPAFIALLLCGGLQRGFQHKGAVLMFLFAFWMVAAVPTSYWPGGSFARVQSYLQYELPLLILLGGLAVNWDDVKKIFVTLAWSGIGVLILTRLTAKMEQGRIMLDFGGTIANANDLASELLLELPFFLFMVIDKKRMFPIRLLFVGAIAYAIYITLGTASRGALVALFCGLIFVVIYASMAQRLAVLVLLPLLAIGSAVLLPQQTMGRLGVLFGEKNEEAEESGASRQYLFEQSVIFTLQHPLFGVGPDQFASFEGQTRMKEGLRGNWHVSHCSWTQVSSECGIPALLFYAGAIIWAFRRVKRAYKYTRSMEWTEGSNACFCFLLSMIFFFVSITFLSNAYTFRQPSLIAIGLVMSLAVERIVCARRTAAAEQFSAA